MCTKWCNFGTSINTLTEVDSMCGQFIVMMRCPSFFYQVR